VGMAWALWDDVSPIGAPLSAGNVASGGSDRRGTYVLGGGKYIEIKMKSEGF